ncbi:MAG: hypothetical protein DI538_13220 [Azospira oryzae]|nr:MAG: hypothetical protein DI538_13220 [Azospira oryzae]
MRENIQLSIPAPCHEDWNSFKPTAQGGFCGSCQKEVIDFTHWEEERIKAYFKSKPSNTCGRFKQTQLRSYTVEQSANPWSSWIRAVSISALLIFSSRPSNAQVKGKIKPDTVQQNQHRILKGDTISTSLSYIKVRGVVLSADDHLPIPGVNVIRKGTDQITVTDAEGHFELEIRDTSSSEQLLFSFIGMIDSVKAVDVHRPESELTVRLTTDEKALNEGVVVGGLVSTRWYHPRGWWWSVLGLFRRY